MPLFLSFGRITKNTTNFCCYDTLFTTNNVTMTHFFAENIGMRHKKQAIRAECIRYRLFLSVPVYGI